MKKLGLFLLVFFFLNAIVFTSVGRNVAFAQSSAIPNITKIIGNQQVLIPDWSHTTWSELPPIKSSGQVEVPPDLIKQIGWDPSRTWNSGQTSDQFTKLGDVEDTFHLGTFSLDDISKLTGKSVQKLHLNDLGLTQWQTPSSLLKAIPELGNINLSEVQPFQDLAARMGVNASGSIADIVQQNQIFADTPLKELNLTQYSIDSIPGISQTYLAKFGGWQQSLIAQVPGLSQISFGQFPTPLNIGGLTLAKMDLPWGKAEHGDPQVDSSYFVSGSINQQGQTKAVACSAGKSCPYLELSDPLLGANGPLNGKRWASGDQQVEGGFGPLAILNGGKEPAGRVVFGADFGKIVVTNINESKGNADFALYKRVCAHFAFIGKSCSPFFIGPIPLPFSTSEGEMLIVSALSAPSISIPQKYQDRIAQIEAQSTPKQTTPDTGKTPNSSQATADSGGESDQKIVAAINNVGDFSTVNIPNTDGGNNACMWATNHVLENAGYEPLANGTLSVLEGKAALDNGRGQKIDIADAKPGDIVLVDAGGSHQHIGFCETDGCTRTISNSSSQAQFSWHGNSNFSYDGSPYNGTTPQVYRLVK